MKTISGFCACIITFLGFITFATYNARAEEISGQKGIWQNYDYLVSGVYHLIIQEDPSVAEQEFKRAILASPIELLKDAKIQSYNRYVIADSFYFLGKIYYDKSVSGNNIQDIGKAKGYLGEAEKYGTNYGILRPNLLKELNRKYPNVKANIPELNFGDANIIFEIGNESFQIDAVEISKEINIVNDKFTTNENVKLRGGATYKIEPNIDKSYINTYRALTMVGIGLVIWLAR